MMGAVREWMAAVVTVSLLTAVLRAMVPEGTLNRTVSFLSGVILLIVLCQPAIHWDDGALNFDFSQTAREIEHRQEEMEASNQAALREGIEARTASYISDKAEELGLSVSVRVQAEDNGNGLVVPVFVEITGPRSQQLAQWMATELDLPEERQVWHET